MKNNSSNQDTIKTTNPEWGFFGTTKSNSGASDTLAALEFNEAAWALVVAMQASPEAARILLDSPAGRHIADQRKAGEAAGDLSTRLSQSWKPFMIREIAKAEREVEVEEERRSR